MAEATYPYVQGAAFIQDLHARAHGWQLVNEAETRPPDSSEQVLHVSDWLTYGDAHALAFDVGTLPRRWRMVSGGPFGSEFTTDTLLAPGMRPGVVPTVAAGWDGAEVELWRRRTSLPCPAGCPSRSLLVLVWRWKTLRDGRLGTAEVRAYAHRVLQGRARHPVTGARSAARTAVRVIGIPSFTILTLAPSERLSAAVTRTVALSILDSGGSL